VLIVALAREIKFQDSCWRNFASQRTCDSKSKAVGQKYKCLKNGGLWQQVCEEEGEEYAVFSKISRDSNFVIWI